MDTLRQRKRSFGYSSVAREETDGFVDEQFVAPQPKIPWKTVFYVLILMTAGAICLAFGILISTGYFDAKYQDRSLPFLIVGIIMFIPGGWYGYILLCICLKRCDFTWDDLPVC